MAAAELYLAADDSVLTAQQIAKLSEPERNKAKARGLRKKDREAFEHAGYVRGLEDGRGEFQQYVARAVDVFDKTRSREERKHGAHQKWFGFALGMLAGTAVAGAFFAYAMWATVQQMTEVFNRATVNGMVMATQQHAAPCTPGQPLADGTRCPQPVASP